MYVLVLVYLTYVMYVCMDKINHDVDRLALLIRFTTVKTDRPRFECIELKA